MEYLSYIKQPIQTEFDRFNQLFANSIVSTNPLLNSVSEYVFRKSGKQMRPILVLLFAKLHDEVTEASLHAAVALELLHTASLIHDDVVDESLMRRGQPSVNASFNNKVAVLSGDYLLATSLAQAAMTNNLDIISIISSLGKDLADGELLQLSNVGNQDFSEDIYYDVIKKKTAVLFISCAKAGALSAGISDEKVQNAALIGEYIGICFQIKDDIFDYFRSDETGKPSGNDMQEGKLTLPVLHVLNTTDDEEAKRIALRVKQGVATSEEISHLVEFTKQHRGIEYALSMMDEYRNKALSLLNQYEDGPVKSAIQAYLDYVINRNK
ncbi:MAG: polyprenyl synthetase family protein [Bacteroides sp.]|nr:polyprenyl synthetase family protein [Bacteroides sp.]